MHSFASSQPIPVARQDHRFIQITLLALVAIGAWDAWGWDIPLAALFTDNEGFFWNHHWFLNVVMHSGAKWVNSFLWAALLMMLTLHEGVGVLGRLSSFRRVTLVVTIVAAALAVASVKRFSSTSCPWDLVQFGGTVPYVGHWAEAIDGGPGHCFPAGHASVGFSWLAMYFALRDIAPRTARRTLVGALLAGLVLGLAQQMRGAHFMSHTLWTAWICWTVCGALQFLVDRIEPRFTRWRAAASNELVARKPPQSP